MTRVYEQRATLQVLQPIPNSPNLREKQRIKPPLRHFIYQRLELIITRAQPSDIPYTEAAELSMAGLASRGGSSPFPSELSHGNGEGSHQKKEGPG